MKKLLLSLFLFFSFWICRAQCDPPTNLSVNPGSASADVSCFAMGNVAGFGVYVTHVGGPPPSAGQNPDIIFDSAPGYIPNLLCNTTYAYYACSLCSDGYSSWAGPFYFNTEGCFEFGLAYPMSACAVDGEACFDLHQNDANILNGGSDDDQWYDVHYYTNFDDFQNQTNDVDSVCLASGSATIYVHALEYWTMQESFNQFQITAQENNCNGINLNAFLDTNNNGIKDSGESNFPFGQFTYQIEGQEAHTISPPAGFYKISDNDETHVYDLSFAISPQYVGYYSVPTNSYDNVNPAVVGFTDYQFPVVPTTTYHDATVSLATIRVPVPGFEHNMVVKYTNTGNQPESGTVTFNNAPEEIFIDAIASQGGPITTTPTGFTYNFSNLAPMQSATILVKMQVPPIPTVSIGQLVQHSASVAIENAISESISASMILDIRGSWDPNDKLEARGPEIDVDSFTAADDLTYTIRFENTGNLEALNIKVTDVLTDQFDASTVRMIASSHDVIMDRVGPNITWRFNSINLPPTSETDPLQGHGYVTFAVKPVSFAVGDVIPNFASIYFDFNPAVVTDAFETRFVETLGVNAFENQSFALHPNPVNDQLTVVSNGADIESVAIFDVSGKQIQSRQFQELTSAVLDVSSLQTGMYFVKVTTDSGLILTKKMIKN